MKIIKLILFIAVISSCSNSSDKKFEVQKINKTDTANWQKNFCLTHNPEIDSIWGKPVKFYIDNPKCSAIAIDFYKGKFRPADNDSTATLLSLATTEDSLLRPLYRWCLNKTIQIQDGALGEYTGVPARQYAEKFPKELFAYLHHDITGGKYKIWVKAISYSGYYNKDEHKNSLNTRNRMKQAMYDNCRKCSDELKKQIDKFTADCFP